MITIDGSYGEGGGQILRTALTLSMLLKKTVRITNIRANRKKSGLMRQHLACVQGAKTLCRGSVVGAELNSSEIIFEPGEVIAGDYEFDIGSAGSTTLLFQTLLLPLLLAKGQSNITFIGGTHNPMAPSLTFIQYGFIPLLKKMGAKIDLSIEQWGYTPSGGGKWSASIRSSQLKPLFLTEPGELKHSSVYSYVSNLNKGIAERELAYYEKQSTIRINQFDIHTPHSVSPGNTLMHRFDFEFISTCFTQLGRQKLSAEKVAKNLLEKVEQYLASKSVLNEHLTDQMMLPMVIANGGRFSCTTMSEHGRTNAYMIKLISGQKIEVTDDVERVIISLN